MTEFAFYPADRRHALERRAAEFGFFQTEPTPWTPLHRSLPMCQGALVTTAGLRLKTQVEYAADRLHGSPDFREISMYVSRATLTFDFTNFDPREAEEDLNVVAPVDRIKELAEERVLAGVSETFFSFYGLCDDVNALRDNAREVGRKMREDYAIDVVFIVPANFACNQTAAEISRELERSGLSTVTLVTVKEIAAQIRVPRPLFINFPFGRTLGPAHAIALQRSIVNDMVAALRTSDRPGRMRDLPYHWEGMLP
ncbi:MAG: hypothetical protein HY716_18845 [Planctomycetes bacterium]|nr:hypothetical protein [Planctomycetota bacterium]